MTIRDNLIISCARRDVVARLAQYALRDVSDRMTPAERRIARLASSIAMVRWHESGCPDQGPVLTPEDIESAALQIENLS